MANNREFRIKNGIISLNDLNVTGNITVSGTVDGRDLASDGTKLDGVTTGAEPNEVTLAGSETLTNKTLTQPLITLNQALNPTPTAEGDIRWDTDDNTIKIGDGVGTKIFSSDSDISITESQISDLGAYITASSVNTLTNKTFDANGTGNSISNVDLAADVIGNLPVTNLNSGTSASAATFWRGDGTWATPAGSGDVVKVGTPVNNQVGVWTGDGTIEGDTALTFDTTTDTLTVGASGKIAFGAVIILTDTAGTTTLQNIDAIDATTTSTYEGALTLDNLQGNLSVSHLNSGTGASAATFWRGDGTWATPAGSGDVTKVGTPVNNQIGVWTGDGTIEGDANLTWTGSLMTVTGSIDVSSTLGINNIVDFMASTANLTTVTPTAVATFVAANYGSAKFIIQVHDNVSGERHSSEMLIIHDGTTASATEYGIIFSGASALATFDVDINAGNVRLLATSASTNSTDYNVIQILTTV